MVVLSCMSGMLTSLLFVIIVYCMRDCSLRRLCQCISSQCCCRCCQVTAGIFSFAVRIIISKMFAFVGLRAVLIFTKMLLLTAAWHYPIYDKLL